MKQGLARFVERHRILLARLVLSLVLSVSVDRILSAMRHHGVVELVALFLIWFAILWVGDTIRESGRSRQKPEDPAR